MAVGDLIEWETMQAWNNLYEQPAVLSVEWAHQRIYAAGSYAHIRALRDVPIILSEAMTLASHFPLCWKLVDGHPVLVALRSLLPDGRGHYPAMRRAIPLCLQAYPFKVPDPVMIERQQIVVDRTFADRPTDIGAPILQDNGRMGRGALIRARLALEVARGIAPTDRLSEDLWRNKFLEPWPLAFDLAEAQQVERDDLLVIAASKLASPALFGLIEAHGPDAGVFMAVQRLSLFRIGAIVQLAKRAAAQPTGPEALELFP
jgi:hypothetical protein